MPDIKLGTIIEAPGIASNEIAEYFGPRKVKGLYIGDNRIYFNKKVYPIKIDKAVIIEEPNSTLIKRAKNYRRSWQSKIKQSKNQINQEFKEKNKAIKKVYNLFKDLHLKKNKKGFFTLKGKRTTQKIRNIVNDINTNLIKLKYSPKRKLGHVVYVNKDKSFSDVHVYRRDLKNETVELNYTF